MHNFTKIIIVMAGYVIALAGAITAFYIRLLMTQGPDAQAASGMYAFGDEILFLGVFGLLAIIPTALAFYFLRPLEKLWTGFGVACLAFSLMELTIEIANTLINRIGAYNPTNFGLFLSLIGIFGIFGAPVVLVGFLVLAAIAPSKRSRILMLSAAIIETLLGLYIVFMLLVFNRLF